MRRIIGLTVPLLMAVIVVAFVMGAASAISVTEDAGAAQNELGDPVTVVFWHVYTDTLGTAMQQLIDEFNATNSYDITVQGQYVGGYADSYEAVLLGLQGGGPLPNLVTGYANMIADYARYGGVRFLDDYFQDPEIGISDPEDFFPSALSYLQLGQYGNQLAGLPNGMSVEVMYYNATLLDEKALSIPATWDAFESACVELTTDTVVGTVVDMNASRFISWLWSRGGELLSEDLTYSRFQEQEGIDSVQFFRNLFDGGYAREPGELYGDQAAFGNGETGLTFGHSTGIPYYRELMEDGAGHDWGVALVPSLPGIEVTDAVGRGIAVLHRSEDQDRAAWLFLRWLTEPGQTARWAAKSPYFPVRISATYHPSMVARLAEDEQYAQAYALMPLGRSEPGIRNYTGVRAIVEGAVAQVLVEGADTIDTLQAAAVAVDALLDESAPTSGVITAGGGTLIYENAEGLSVTIEFPEGAVEDPQIVSYVPLDDLPTDGLAFALVPNLTFNEPVWITIEYLDSDVAGMDENELKLYTYDWATWSWVDADPCGGYVRDLLNNILEAGVCHFSDYAVIGWPYQIYLPVVLRNG